MRPIHRIFTGPIHGTIAVLTLLAFAAPAGAQRTVTQDQGAGQKLELHYDAAGNVVETRTIAPNGQVLEKVSLDRRPGAYVPQSTSTSYWPNGKVHKITQNTYDNNSNFLGEFVQVFDDTGKQIGGHRLTHDPQTNSYTCADWNTAAQAYKPIQCPAGEESSGTPETVKTFTADQVMQQLAQARELQKNPPPARREAAAPASGTATNVREVGLVLPAHFRPNERVSGSVVEDPNDYAGLPNVTVTRVALPFAPSGAGSTLAGWKVEMSGEPPQQADGPIALTIPPGQVVLAILFRQSDREGAPVSKEIPIPAAPKAKAKPGTSYVAPALCLKDQLCIVHGPFTGDSSKTFAAIENRPAKIVAETTDAAYIAIPAPTEGGSRPLVIAEGSKAIAFPLVVAEYSILPDRRTLAKGEKLLMYSTIDGPQELPDPLWRAGNYPASNLEEARKLVPGLQLPRAGHEDKDKDKKEAKEKAGDKNEEGEGGQILLVVKNLTPNEVTFRESKNETYVFHLTPASFQMGEFKYKFVVDATAAGSFAVQSTVIPLFAPVTGQEFPLTAAGQ